MKRVHCFFDGQNLFYQAKHCFGYNTSNYDILSLAKHLTHLKENRKLTKLLFYTGIPKKEIMPRLHSFWTAKLSRLGKDARYILGEEGIKIYTKELKYREEQFYNESNDEYFSIKLGREKGVDIRLALDLVAGARKNEYDIAVIFSQDTDLEEAVIDVIEIAKEQNRYIQLECAFPFTENPINPETNLRGISRTDWIKINKAEYDKCIDPKTEKYWP